MEEIKMKSNIKKPLSGLKKHIITGILFVLAAATLITPVMANAWSNPSTHAPHSTHGWNTGEGRHGPINENDFHTASWDRFGPMNYQFSSGANWNQIFGRHTFAPNFTPDTTFQNIRRDRHAAHRPLPYGIFSSVVSTPMVNPTFQQAVHHTNQQQPFVTQNPHIHSFTNHGMGMSHSTHSQNFIGHGSAWGQSGSGWSDNVNSAGHDGGMLPHTSILD